MPRGSDFSSLTASYLESHWMSECGYCSLNLSSLQISSCKATPDFSSLCQTQTRSLLGAKTAFCSLFLITTPTSCPMPWLKHDVRRLPKAARGRWPDGCKQPIIAFPFSGCCPLWKTLSHAEKDVFSWCPLSLSTNFSCTRPSFGTYCDPGL